MSVCQYVVTAGLRSLGSAQPSRLFLHHVVVRRPDARLLWKTELNITIVSALLLPFAPTARRLLLFPSFFLCLLMIACRACTFLMINAFNFHYIHVQVMLSHNSLDTSTHKGSVARPRLQVSTCVASECLN